MEKDKVNLQLQNMALLHARFYQALDISQASQILSEFENSQKPLRYPLLGEGSFCTAYKVTASASQTYCFALCIAHTPYSGPSDLRQQKNLHRWRKRLLSLQAYAQDIPLAPPLTFLQGKQLLGWLTPFGDSNLAAVLPQWQPLSEPIARLHAALDARGFCLGDVLQLKHWQGIPFVCDLSDLEDKATRG